MMNTPLDKLKRDLLLNPEALLALYRLMRDEGYDAARLRHQDTNESAVITYKDVRMLVLAHNGGSN